MDKRRKALITRQIKDLHRKAMARPMPQDPLGMCGLMAALVAVQMQSQLLQAEMAEAAKEQGNDHAN